MASLSDFAKPQNRVIELESFQDDFLNSLIDGDGWHSLAERFETLTELVIEAQQAGELHGSVASIGVAIASNIRTLVTSEHQLDSELEQGMADLGEILDCLLLGGMQILCIDQKKDTNSSLRRLADDRNKRCRKEPHPSFKRLRPLSYSSLSSSDSPTSDSDSNFTPIFRPSKPHPATSKPHPTNSKPLIPPIASPTRSPNPTDHLRLWFLQNLSNPYPTPAEKDFLATAAGVPRSKIDSDLTNWRRRAGWTDIKDRWAERDKAKMRRLIEGYEEGAEMREEVVEEIQRMRGYLERREEERVGDWVHEVGLPLLSLRSRASKLM